MKNCEKKKLILKANAIMELSRKIQYLRSYNSFEWDKIIYRKPLITDAMKI